MCSGLQTFLGFSEETKGYDGTGIVYSDLDRLCDGVMSFILQCLKGSKTLLVHYFPKIDDTIRDLENAIGKGSGVVGFREAIGIVQAGLRGYEGGMEGRIEEFKSPITYIKDDIPKVTESLNNVENKKLSTQLVTVQQKSKTYEKRVELAKKAYENLDDGLKGKLKRNMSLVSQAVKTFKDIAEDTNVVTQAKEVDKALREKRDAIKKDIVDQSRIVQDTLDSGFGEIQKGLNGFKTMKLTQQIQSIRDAVNDALLLFDWEVTNFDTNYTDKILKEFEGLKKHMTEITKNKGVPNTSELYTKIDGITGMLNEMEQEIQRGAGKIGEAIDNAVIAVNSALGQLDEKVRDDLNTLKTQMEGQITTVITFLKLGIQQAGAVASSSIDGTDGAQSIVNEFKKNLLKVAPALYKWADNAQSSKLTAALDGLSDDALGVAGPDPKTFTHLRGFLSKFADNDQLKIGDHTFFEALIEDMKLNINNKIDEIKEQLETHMPQYTAHTKQNGRESLKYKIGDIKTGLLKFFTGPINGDDDQFDIEHAEHFSVFNANKKQALAAIENALLKIGALEYLPDALDTAQQEAETFMAQLRSNIVNVKQKTESVLAVIDEAEETLNQSIDSIQLTLTSRQTKSQQAVSSLQTKLLAAVSSAFSTLTHQVQSLFARQKQAELTQLQGVVETQLEAIKKIIHDDSINGVKGFLARLNGGFDETLQITTLNSNTKLDGLASNVRLFLYPLLQYVIAQITPNVRPQPPTADPHATKVTDIQTKLNTLLSNLSSEQSTKKYRFDDQFSRDLDALKASVGALNADKFGDGKHPELLNIVKEGVTSFDTQLEYGYVNKYSGLSFSGDMLIDIITSEAKTTELTDEGRNAAKAFFTLLNVLYEDMATLKERCEDATKYGWKDKKICKTQNRTGNSLGAFFERCGYRIPTDDQGKQDAELQCKEEWSGGKIYEHLRKSLQDTYNNAHLNTCVNEKHYEGQKAKTLYDLFDLLDCLLSHFNEYNEVCHYSTLSATKSPCSIFEILVWMSGLPHHPVFTDMRDVAVTDLFEDPKKKTKEVIDGVEMEVTDMSTVAIRALPHDITYNHTQAAVTHMCSQAYDLLVCILGTGDAETIYGVDFWTNSLKLKYPNRGADCLQMFLEILRRLLPTLRYLEHMCSYPASIGGWSQCRYGKDVKPAKWPCDKHPKPEPRGQPKGQATDQPNSEPMCQPKSPLQSYLNDCLPGHLPHRLESVGCKAECKTCPTSQRGSPCVTPLGFKTFSGSMRRGRDICDVLAKLLDDVHLRSLLCLVTKPPASLPEHFQFTLALVNGWHNDSKYVKDVIQTNIENSAKEVSIHLYNEPSKLTIALSEAYGSSQSRHDKSKHKTIPVKGAEDEPSKADVSSLCMTITCPGENHCAPYLSSLYRDYYICLPFKNSRTYLSWAIYLPWTFWDLLNNLYNTFCQINCQDWGCRGCLRGDKCRSGKHGVVEDEKKQDDVCQCDSIVQCKGVSSTFYQYGFSFGEASTLNSGSTAKKCKDFCSQLKKVLASEYFKELFKECDNFLKEIRWPFMCTLLALWSLSLLYLLHIAVVRLDVLRIRSHLRSPSSHRIAAQSLLAAARVRALANVKYFSP
ncbi:hypothetical protein, conserved [Babesia ovata]|uniref:C3H1-type domain-containing protein n=1 Tax=Babesia ovata TaxID=189622 RepID=A0A2H6KAH5_9APIC|nr:uncharacterized protein BOVATA_014830 [Babesia ovata]GBE59990.1 hypothetical protein, conserved [Babesia ovata]